MRAEAEAWVKYAEDDLQMSSILVDQGLARGSVFHAHEAVEKVLKAIWIDRWGEQPEKTHNLLYLVKALEIELSRGQREFLKRLNWQLIPSRYPEGEPPDADAVRWYHEQAQELYEWLLRHLT
jgi:HEPN domain-containing protein